MNAFEDFALGNFLCEWPKDLTFKEIITIMIDNDPMGRLEEISKWYPFENWKMIHIAELISNMKKSLEKRFVEKV